jgi:hypothetical protein
MTKKHLKGEHPNKSSLGPALYRSCVCCFLRPLNEADVNAILDRLDDDDSSLEFSDDEDVGVTYVNIAVVPPVEEPGADTDEDSDKSDNESSGDFKHLLGRILGSQSELTVGKRKINLSGEKTGNVEVNYLYISVFRMFCKSVISH